MHAFCSNAMFSSWLPSPNEITSWPVSLSPSLITSPRYPFTICNIMCIGNVVGVLTLFPVFHRQLRLAHLKRVTPLQWGWMLLGCLLSNVLGSVAYLQGLRLTSVPARAMTGRLESVDFLAASACFLGDRYSAWVQANALLTVLGVVAAVLYRVYVQHHPWEGMVGYSFLVLGGWGYTLSLIITKKYLVQLPVGLLSLFKLAIGTLLFHLLSVWQHGAMDVPSLLPFPSLYPSSLLRTMLWYAPLFVTSTQVLWLRAVKFCSPSVLSIGMNANFVVTVLMGGLILGTWPTTGELVGGAVIVGSIVSGITETVVEKRGESVVEDTREVAEEEGRYECGRETTKESIRPRLSYGEEDAEETAMLHGGSACQDTRKNEKVSLWNTVRQ